VTKSVLLSNQSAPKLNASILVMGAVPPGVSDAVSTSRTSWTPAPSWLSPMAMREPSGLTERKDAPKEAISPAGTAPAREKEEALGASWIRMSPARMVTARPSGSS